MTSGFDKDTILFNRHFEPAQGEGVVDDDRCLRNLSGGDLLQRQPYGRAALARPSSGIAIREHVFPSVFRVRCADHIGSDGNDHHLRAIRAVLKDRTR